MKLQAFIFVAFLTCVYCLDNVKIGVIDAVDSTGDESELVSVDLKRKDGKEEIKLIAQMRIHLVNGKVHLNGNMLEHGVVNHIKMRLTIIEFENGIQKAELKPVRLRVLVLENTSANGNKVLIVEEEFMQVEEYEVFQVDVKQVIFESMVRKPVTVVSLKESKIHAKPQTEDHHVLFKDDKYRPSLPDHPLQSADHSHCHHHHKHHGGHKHGHKHGKHILGEAKCWYHNLSWKSKFALFATGFLAMITMVLLCLLHAKRRRHHRSLEVPAPIDDTVTVDMDEVKKGKTDEKFEFHFEFDNAVVVDDKKALIE